MFRYLYFITVYCLKYATAYLEVKRVAPVPLVLFK
jgi:hypothetical protein